MKSPRKYAQELRERAIRLVLDAREDAGTRSGACRRTADQVGIKPETLRGWDEPSRDLRPCAARRQVCVLNDRHFACNP